jgi:hypothetical protein
MESIGDNQVVPTVTVTAGEVAVVWEPSPAK